MTRLKHFLRLNYGDALAVDTRRQGEVTVYGSNGGVGFHDIANTRGPAIIVGRKGSHGKVTWTSKPSFCIDTAYYVDERHCSGNLRFAFYLLNSLELDRNTRDTGVPGLERNEAHNRRVWLPDLPTQKAIADFLDRETARIDQIIEKAGGSEAAKFAARGSLLALLLEYRSALITAAVTGQIDVVAWSNRGQADRRLDAIQQEMMS